jgi:hypothetical protein
MYLVCIIYWIHLLSYFIKITIKGCNLVMMLTNKHICLWIWPISWNEVCKQQLCRPKKYKQNYRKCNKICYIKFTFKILLIYKKKIYGGLFFIILFLGTYFLYFKAYINTVAYFCIIIYTGIYISAYALVQMTFFFYNFYLYFYSY